MCSQMNAHAIVFVAAMTASLPVMQSDLIAEEGRRATAEEVRALAREVWKYPPSVYDITVITTTHRTPWTESEVRRSVEKSFAQQKADNPRFDDSAERLESQVRRMLDLENVPFVRKERWRHRDLDFCVDIASRSDASMVIDADTPFEECLLFLQEDLGRAVVSARKDYESRTLSVDGPDTSWLIERTNLWEGGAFSFRTCVVLKSLFGWKAINDREPEIDESRISDIVTDRVKGVGMKVFDEGQRKTIVVSAGDASARITYASDRVMPVLHEEFRAAGQLVSRMTVTELGADGEPLEFEMVGPPKRPNEPAIPVKVRVLSRQIGGELPADTFSLDRPEGWSKWDGRTRELVDFDGNPREAPPRRAPPTVVTPDSAKRTLFLANIAIFGSLAAYWLWLRWRRNPRTGGR